MKIQSNIARNSFPNNLGNESIVGFVEQYPELRRFYEVAQFTNLWHFIPPNTTVFAPNNEAWSELEREDLELMQDTERLKKIIGNSVLGKREDVNEMVGENKKVYAIRGNPIKVSKTPEGIMVNDKAHVVRENVFFGDSFINIIDKVIQGTYYIFNLN